MEIKEIKWGGIVFFQLSLGLNSPPGSCAVEVATKTALARYKNEDGSAQE